MNFLIIFCVGLAGLVGIYTLLCLIGVGAAWVILKTIKDPINDLLELATNLRDRQAAWYKVGYAVLGVLACAILVVIFMIGGAIIFGIGDFGLTLIRSF